jgi:glutamate synthase domain-containing protein 3
MHFHGHAQDQVGQVIRRGKVVIHGDVGQTFLYGAKGGDIYVRGSAAGRPLINAVGKPRAVINGSCLDYLAEAFMAGDPLNGGGFVIVNGITFDEAGRMIDMETPYPGGNLFSLASGGAVYCGSATCGGRNRLTGVSPLMINLLSTYLREEAFWVVSRS